MTQWQETLVTTKTLPTVPDAREAEGVSIQPIPTQENNTQGVGAQMHNSNEVNQRYPQKHSSPTSK